MSLKARLVTVIMAFFLVLGLLITGVFAAKKATFNVGGTISFEATNVYCQVTGSYVGGAVNPTPQTLLWNSNISDSPSEEALDTWNGSELAFDEDGNLITFTITIENLSEELSLDVKFEIDTTDKVTNDVVERTISYIDENGTVDENPVGVLKNIPIKKTAKFEITYKVVDDNFSISELDYAYVISLESEKA